MNYRILVFYGQSFLQNEKTKKKKKESYLRINKNRIQAIYTSFQEFSFYLPQGRVEILLFIYAYFKHFLQRIALIDLLAFP